MCLVMSCVVNTSFWVFKYLYNVDVTKIFTARDTDFLYLGAGYLGAGVIDICLCCCG